MIACCLVAYIKDIPASSFQGAALDKQIPDFALRSAVMAALSVYSMRLSLINIRVKAAKISSSPWSMMLLGSRSRYKGKRGWGWLRQTTLRHK